MATEPPRAAGLPEGRGGCCAGGERGETEEEAEAAAQPVLDASLGPAAAGGGRRRALNGCVPLSHQVAGHMYGKDKGGERRQARGGGGGPGQVIREGGSSRPTLPSVYLNSPRAAVTGWVWLPFPSRPGGGGAAPWLAGQGLVRAGAAPFPSSARTCPPDLAPRRSCRSCGGGWCWAWGRAEGPEPPWEGRRGSRSSSAKHRPWMERCNHC